MKLRKHTLHIKQAISVVLLLVFAIALTPFSVLHHHHDEEPVCLVDGKNCVHKNHIASHEDTCLICKAHFEKNYTSHQFTYHVYQEAKPVSNCYTTVSGSYAELIRQSLRGPPVA